MQLFVLALIALSVWAVFLTIIVAIAASQLFHLKAEVEGMRRSTHQIVMPTQQFETLSEEQRATMQQSIDEGPEDFRGIM